MAATETITINVPIGMSRYLIAGDPESELRRNALLLYPYIYNQTISHGRAAEILGVSKSDLITIYDKLGYSYYDLIQDDLEDDIDTFKKLKGMRSQS
ncbi:hypothetical protein [Lachnoanaerobaculum saburreum]|uniref:Uncharacterized protein n=1 Tax=Lachnoanaerobaculum saburreum DSM 3986 TaxID=887325 RepID=E6LLD8_9FIRM|nr:hypothetical protein [Lachnoanaerobaculum saburreum]EFU77327.1 hypothetical protein HMPREF0381_0773 [Lachnoanaerobaculum saburreum DSM 3986]